MTKRRKRLSLRGTSYLIYLTMLNLFILSQQAQQVSAAYQSHHDYSNSRHLNTQHYHHSQSHQSANINDNNNNNHHNNHQHHQHNYNHPSEQPQRDDYFVGHQFHQQNEQQASRYSQTHQQQQSQTTTSHHTQIPSIVHLCSQVSPSVSRHLKLCKLVHHSPGADMAVTHGTSKGLAECRQQFKSERWNCTHPEGDHKLLTSPLAQSLGNRESGFLQAIAAAGIVHSIAVACSVGSLSDCACDKARLAPVRRQGENWKWGGCSNNIRHGMVYAKHLVELLDAVHLHYENGGSTNNNNRYRRWIGNNRQRDPNAINVRSSSPLNPTDRSAIAVQQQVEFCAKNHNLTQATQLQLIKSLLSKNSLERHQEFRLAMNMHNNKVGRMAVSSKMELRCRCHGLSGSCSLKTCWLTLPKFQVIGDYLRQKYEASVHLLTAVRDLNKLIPMMDRNEFSAILSQPSLEAPPEQRTHLASLTSTTPSPEVGESFGMAFRAAVEPPSGRNQGRLVARSASLSGHLISPSGQSGHQAVQSDIASSLTSYYEQHRQIQLMRGQQMARGSLDGAISFGLPGPQTTQPPPTTTTTTSSTTTTTTSPTPYETQAEPGEPDSSLEESPLMTGNEQFLNLTNLPSISQQQYQALLREMRLCNINGNANGGSSGQKGYQQNVNRLKKASSSSMSRTVSPTSTGSVSVQTGSQQQQQQLSHLMVAQNRDELVHLHRSPDYCAADERHGFAGVRSRTCSSDRSAPDSCDRLCCGRGYNVHRYEEIYKCHCKFQYCCEVKCQDCRRAIKVLVCN